MRISGELRDRMREMGERAYPYEGCGILLGTFGAQVEVVEVREGANLRQDRARDRYILDPKAILQAEKDARGRGIDVVGFWHTHPDHPARPSQYDADHAWPEYVYVIMAIEGGSQADVNAFVLRQEAPPEFGPEEIS